jgi:Uma2 family endonuclease
MAVLVLSPYWTERVLAERQANGANVRDEVWDGVTVIMPEADNEHDDLVGFFRFVFRTVFSPELRHHVHGPVNVSDQPSNWRQNYRIPDVSVFRAGTASENRRTHWFGGPELAIEVVNPDDKSRDKLDFYAKVGTREVLVLDRDPWQLELYQLRGGKMHPNGTGKPGDGVVLVSSIGPLKLELVQAEPRPKVKITHSETGQEWIG